MFCSLSAKFFSMLAGLSALLGITNTTLCCMKARSKIRQLLSIYFFEDLYFLCLAHKKFRVLAGAVCEILAIEKCICSKRQRKL